MLNKCSFSYYDLLIKIPTFEIVKGTRSFDLHKCKVAEYFVGLEELIMVSETERRQGSLPFGNAVLIWEQCLLRNT